MNKIPKEYINPYLAGILLGVVLFLSFLLFGHGLGASGGISKIVNVFIDKLFPQNTDSSSYLIGFVRDSKYPLDYWLVFEIIGVVIGGFISGYTSGRIKVEIYKGPHITNYQRLFFALLGGVIAGYGVKIARGCTSSQALSGGAVLGVGSWVFMFSVFGGAYFLAYFVRKLWN